MITKRYHWIFDAEGIKNSLITKKALLQKALKDLADICGMTIVGGPLIIEGIPENPGLTAVCIVDFSHISIHTFSGPGELCVDVFSCKPYDPQKIKRYLMRTFAANAKKIQFFEVRYPARNKK